MCCLAMPLAVKPFRMLTAFVFVLVADKHRLLVYHMSMEMGGLDIRLTDFMIVYFGIVIACQVLVQKREIYAQSGKYFVIAVLAGIPALFIGLKYTSLNLALRDFELVYYSLFYFVGAAVVTEIRQIKTLARWVLAGFVLRSIYGFIFHMQARHISAQPFEITTLADASHAIFIFLGVLFFVIALVQINALSFPRKTLIGTLLGIVFVAMLLKGFRGSILAAFSGFLVFMFLCEMKSKMKLIGVGLFVVAALWYIAGSGLFLNRQLHERRIHRYEALITGEDATGTGRLNLWSVGWKHFRESPFFGKGYGYYASNPLAIGGGFLGSGSGYHNFFMQLIACSGILGTTPFLLLLASILNSIWRTIRRSGSKTKRMLMIAYLSTYVSFMVVILLNPTLNLPIAILFWLLVAVMQKIDMIPTEEIDQLIAGAYDKKA